MARLFDGVDDIIKCSIGGCNLTQPMSLAAIVRLNSDTGTHSLISTVNSNELSESNTLYVHSDGRIIYYTDTNASYDNTIKLFVADGWALLGGDHPAGTAAARLHRYIYGTNVWTHLNGASTADNTAPGSTGKVVLGRGSASAPASFLNGDLLIAGLWNRRLSDVEWENLPFSLQAWYASAPKGLWLLDQAQTTQNVIDATGNGANQTAITGTTVATNHPKIFNRGESVIYPSVAAAAAAAGHPTMRRWGGVPYLNPGPVRRGRSW